MSEIENNIAKMSVGEVGVRIQELTSQKLALESELSLVNTELKAHANNLKGQLAAVNKLVGQPVKTSGGRGRPRKTVDGEPSVSQQVLELIKSNPGGLQRNEILSRFPDRESAVHAAIRTHQQKGLILNKDHTWHYNPDGEVQTQEVISDDGTEAIVEMGDEVSK